MQLAALAVRTTEPVGIVAEQLADISLAWQVAPADERNKLARQMFNTVVIENKRAVAVTHGRSWCQFLRRLRVSRQASWRMSGSDGIRTRGLSLDRAAC
jgi:hypothetical protein